MVEGWFPQNSINFYTQIVKRDNLRHNLFSVPPLLARAARPDSVAAADSCNCKTKAPPSLISALSCPRALSLLKQVVALSVRSLKPFLARALRAWLAACVGGSRAC